MLANTTDSILIFCNIKWRKTWPIVGWSISRYTVDHMTGSVSFIWKAPYHSVVIKHHHISTDTRQAEMLAVQHGLDISSSIWLQSLYSTKADNKHVPPCHLWELHSGRGAYLELAKIAGKSLALTWLSVRDFDNYVLLNTSMIDGKRSAVPEKDQCALIALVCGSNASTKVQTA